MDEVNLTINGYIAPSASEGPGWRSVNEEQLLRDLGVKWKGRWGNAFLDLVVYTGCTNVPDRLPEWLSVCDDKGVVTRHGGVLDDATREALNRLSVDLFSLRQWRTGRIHGGPEPQPQWSIEDADAEQDRSDAALRLLKKLIVRLIDERDDLKPSN